MDEVELEKKIFDYLDGSLTIEYDTYRREIRLILAKPVTFEPKVISTAWISDLSDVDGGR